MSKIYLIDTTNQRPLEISEQALIGTSASAHLSWEDKDLAPEHLRVSHKNDNFFVEAVSNAYPVQLNGIKLLAGQRYLVRKGDTLKVAGRELVFSQTEELPEKTVTKIKSDLFGLSESDEEEFGDLKLEVAVDESRSPVEMMKKSRKIILEIQETKKQVAQKMQEMHALAKEVEDSSAEYQMIVGQLEERNFGDEKRFFQLKDKLKNEERAARKEVEELEQKLLAAKQKHEKLNTQFNELENIEKLVEQKQLAYARKVEVSHKFETLASIGLEEKLRQLNQCLRDEQDNYQRLHEVSSSYLSGRKKRYG